MVVGDRRMISSSDSDMGGSLYHPGSTAAPPSEHTKLSASVLFVPAQRAGPNLMCYLCAGEEGPAVTASGCQTITPASHT